LNNNNNNSYGSYSGGSDQHGDWLLSVQHSDDLPPAVLATQQEQRRQWEVTLEGVCERTGRALVGVVVVISRGVCVSVWKRRGGGGG
jgi:hypothetical protein